jgi:hypothetical protein
VRIFVFCFFEHHGGLQTGVFMGAAMIGMAYDVTRMTMYYLHKSGSLPGRLVGNLVVDSARHC